MPLMTSEIENIVTQIKKAKVSQTVAKQLEKLITDISEFPHQGKIAVDHFLRNSVAERNWDYALKIVRSYNSVEMWEHLLRNISRQTKKSNPDWMWRYASEVYSAMVVNESSASIVIDAMLSSDHGEQIVLKYLRKVNTSEFLVKRALLENAKRLDYYMASILIEIHDWFFTKDYFDLYKGSSGTEQLWARERLEQVLDNVILEQVLDNVISFKDKWNFSFFDLDAMLSEWDFIWDHFQSKMQRTTLPSIMNLKFGLESMNIYIKKTKELWSGSAMLEAVWLAMWNAITTEYNRKILGPELFALTNDTKYLPEELKSTFLF